VPTKNALQGTTGSSDHAYELIRGLIISGELPEGSWLREGELAERIGVSRTPVREALSRLSAGGLVLQRPNRGVQVKTWTLSDLEEIFSLRSVLEPWGCALAATKDLVDFALLEEIMEDYQVETFETEPDVLRAVALNERFHRTVLEGAGNSRLLATLDSLLSVPFVRSQYLNFTPEVQRSSHLDHVLLIEALRAKDAEWASSVMRAHVRAAWHSIQQANAD